MAKSRLPPLIARALSEHFAESVGHPALDECVVARAGTRNAGRADVVWFAATGESSGSFRCGFCADGFNLFLADVYAAEPTPVALESIRRHFADEHEWEIAVEEIAYEGNASGEKLAMWRPMTPQRPASIVCYLCRQVENTLYLGVPAYGDARRLREMTVFRPELWEEMRGLTPIQQAAYLEARDSGLLQRANAASAEQALRRAKQAQQPRKPRPVVVAYQRLLAERVLAGEQIGQVIEGLEDQMARDPVAFRCLIGEYVDELRPLLDQKMQAKQFAEAVVDTVGKPERDARTIKSYWSEIKDDPARALQLGD